MTTSLQLPHDGCSRREQCVADLEAGDPEEEAQVSAHLTHHRVSVVDIIFLGYLGGIVESAE